jgi:uncharacterized membrane protein
MTAPSKVRLVFLATSFAALAWVAAVFAAPVLRARGAGLAPFLYACFSPLCHQVPERSFIVLGYPLAVCARCLGIYLGFLGGLVLYAARRGFRTLRLPGTAAFVLVTVPILLDTAGNLLGFWSTSNAVRFATGLLWGPVLPFYFVTAVAELALGKKQEVLETKGVNL